MSVKQFGWLLSAVACSAIFASQASAQNLFANPGFEDAATYTEDGPPFVGSWEGFQGDGADATRALVSPRTGLAHLSANINNADNTFAGAFQDVVVSPGQLVNFSLWHRADAVPYTLVSEMRIEWRNSGTNSEVSRNQIVPVPTAEYTLVSLPLTVPAGADTARAVYAVQSFSNVGANLGTVYVDDASFEVVPEPAAGLLSAIALAFGWGVRRRR
jgi:hypothetical protein